MAVSHNGYDPTIVAAFISRIETLQAELKEHSKGIRADIADILTEAEDNEGIPKKALRMLLRDRAFQTRIDKLEGEDGAAYEQLVAALGTLGDTPLAEAAKARSRSTAAA